MVERIKLGPVYMEVFSPPSRGENILPLHGEFQPGMKVCLAPKVDKSVCVINFSARAEKIFAITSYFQKFMFLQLFRHMLAFSMGV